MSHETSFSKSALAASRFSKHGLGGGGTVSSPSSSICNLGGAGVGDAGDGEETSDDETVSSKPSKHLKEPSAKYVQ